MNQQLTTDQALAAGFRIMLSRLTPKTLAAMYVENNGNPEYDSAALHIATAGIALCGTEEWQEEISKARANYGQ